MWTSIYKDIQKQICNSQVTVARIVMPNLSTLGTYIGTPCKDPNFKIRTHDLLFYLLGESMTKSPIIFLH
jgi:hypothetical protein